MTATRLLASATLLTAVLYGQSSSEAKFEVASIRPSAARQGGRGVRMGIRINGDRVEIGDWSMKQLVIKAYGLETYQVSGPEWISTVRFDVIAKLPEGSNRTHLPGMLKSLLVERFGLTTHTEKQELAGYVLAVAKSGLKMKLSALGSGDPPPPNTLDELMGDGRAFGLKPLGPADGNLRVEFTKIPMPALAQLVGSYLRQPVFDMTGLPGRYQARLECSLPASAPAANFAEITSDLGDIFSAVNRLGLRLERSRGLVAMLVVDEAKQVPTDN